MNQVLSKVQTIETYNRSLGMHIYRPNKMASPMPEADVLCCDA